MVTLTDVLIRPIITEKTSDQKGKYTFEIHKDAEKPDVVKALKEFYKVDVEKVNIIRMPLKTRTVGRGRLMKRRGDIKKAVVTTKGGATLEFNAFK